MRKLLYSLTLITFLFTNISAQNKRTSYSSFSQYLINSSLTASYQNGYVFPTNDFVKGINAERDTIDAYQTFSLKFMKQLTGKKLWQQLFNYPEYGGGIYLADFHNPEEIGLPFAFYGYFSAPFHRWQKFTVNYELSLGFALNWKSYSPANHFNISIGANQTAYIDIGIKTEYQISDRLYVDFGFSASHFSNGRLKEPNFGLNTIAPKISLKYNLSKNQNSFIKNDIPIFKKKNAFYYTVFYGSKNILFDSLNLKVSQKFEGESFNTFGLSTTYNRQISYKSKIGFGADISYDGSVNAQIAVDEGETDITPGPFFDNIQMSIFPSYEFVVHKVSVIIQPSFYVYRKNLKNQSPAFYQRIGLKYNFFKNFYAGLNLRAYDYHISDFIEWNLGYRL